MTSWGLDLLSKLAESTSLDAVREDFPRKSDEGLNPAEVGNDTKSGSLCLDDCFLT